MDFTPFDFKLLKNEGPASKPIVKKKSRENVVTNIPGILKVKKRLRTNPTTSVPMVAPNENVRIFINPMQYPSARHIQMARRGFDVMNSEIFSIAKLPFLYYFCC